jgi:hypothetical protein
LYIHLIANWPNSMFVGYDYKYIFLPQLILQLKNP